MILLMFKTVNIFIHIVYLHWYEIVVVIVFEASSPGMHVSAKQNQN